MHTFWLLITYISLSLGKTCTFIGDETCHNGCDWKISSIWTNCEDGFPWNGDDAIITTQGNFTVSLSSSVELGALILGTDSDNSSNLLHLAERTTLTLMKHSVINRGGTLSMASIAVVNGPSILTNKGTILTNGESPRIGVRLLSNSGLLSVRSGRLRIDSDFQHFGILNVSKGEELELNGQNIMLDGVVHLQVDLMQSNPLIIRGDLVLGHRAVYNVEVYGPVDSQYSRILALGSVNLGGTIRVKLMPKFAPNKRIVLAFLESQEAMTGKLETVLDVDDWNYPYCVRCKLFQRPKEVGFECDACQDESIDVTPPQFSSWGLPDKDMMSLGYLLPGLAIIFIFVVLAMGVVELWGRWAQRREQYGVIGDRGDLRL